MSRAVRFDHYGDIDVLNVVDVPMPQASAGRVVVAVKAAGINPGEASIRKGLLHERWPTTFPCGEGSDFAGLVTAVGAGVKGFKVGDEVLGWTDERASHATHLSVPAQQVLPKPKALSWEIAGSLHVAGMAAWASVEAVAPRKGETVVVSGASGGVGNVATQLALLRGAKVIAIASAANHAWLKELGAVPVAHDEHTVEHLRAAAPEGIAGWMDVFGGGYVKMAVELGVEKKRINTVIDFEAAQKLGVQTQGTGAALGLENLQALATLAAEGKVKIPIAATYPLERVRDAYRELEQRRTRGKIVLVNT